MSDEDGIERWPSYAETPEQSHSWTEIAYTVQPRVIPGVGLVAIAGQAYAIRDDGASYFASYDLPLNYPAGFDWTAAVKERLDTFLDKDCSCSRFGPCALHTMKSDEWSKQDTQRNRIVEADIPGPLKKLLVQSSVRLS